MVEERLSSFSTEHIHHVGEQPPWGYPVSERVTFDRNGVLAGFRASIPIALGVAIYGLVFGLLARRAGLRVLETGLMSAFVFGGSAQFVAIELWQTPLPSLTIIFTTLIVNLRHILWGPRRDRGSRNSGRRKPTAVRSS